MFSNWLATPPSATLPAPASAPSSGPSASITGFAGFGNESYAEPSAVLAGGPSPGRVPQARASPPNAVRATPPVVASLASDTAADMVRGTVEVTPLSRAFFSAANVAMVQNLIRYRVFERSGRVIDPQSAEELLNVMRGFFLQEARHVPGREREEIARLNERAAQWAAPRILAEVDMHARYLQELDTLPTPLAHPVHVGSAGTKSLPFRQLG